MEYQYTNNFKDRHKGGKFGWFFRNVHERINDKVGMSDLTIRCYAPRTWRTTNKAEYKYTFSYLRKARRTLLENTMLVTLRRFPFEL